MLQGGYASEGLLAWVALSKYVDHLTLYRIEQMSARWGAQISRHEYKRSGVIPSSSATALTVRSARNNNSTACRLNVS